MNFTVALSLDVDVPETVGDDGIKSYFYTKYKDRIIEAMTVRFIPATHHGAVTKASNVQRRERFSHGDGRRQHTAWDERGMPRLNAMAREFNDEAAAVKYLIQNGVVDVADTCKKCGDLMSWAQKWPEVENIAVPYNCFMRRCRNRSCRATASIFKGTILERCCEPKNEFLFFVYLWLCGDTTASIRSKLPWDFDTIRQWGLFLREVCMLAVVRQQENEQIGGPGVEVQIDESKFGKCKYGRGHPVMGTWVFGGVEIVYDEKGRARAGRCFAVAVPDRKARTLLPILQKFVAPGSHITSDEWGSYNGIGSLSQADGSYIFTHATVKHEECYKDPITGTHTNVIEGQWRWMKQAVPHRVYYDGDKVQTCLYKYMWDRAATTSRWKKFIGELSRFRLAPITS
jgi:hypothetical protein